MKKLTLMITMLLALLLYFIPNIIYADTWPNPHGVYVQYLNEAPPGTLLEEFKSDYAQIPDQSKADRIQGVLGVKVQNSDPLPSSYMSAGAAFWEKYIVTGSGAATSLDVNFTFNGSIELKADINPDSDYLPYSAIVAEVMWEKESDSHYVEKSVYLQYLSDDDNIHIFNDGIDSYDLVTNETFDKRILLNNFDTTYHFDSVPVGEPFTLSVILAGVISGDYNFAEVDFLDTVAFKIDDSSDSPFSLQEGYTIEKYVVPIPSAVWLLGSGLIGIVGIRRKFKT